MLNNIMVTSLATQFIWKITESDYTLMALSSFFSVSLQNIFKQSCELKKNSHYDYH